MRLIRLFEAIDYDDERGELIPNPMPHLSSDDPKFGEWYDRADEILSAYTTEHNLQGNWGQKTLQARDALGSVSNVPVGKLIGSEPMLSKATIETGEHVKSQPSSKHPVVYIVDGNLFIADGNHRAARAFVNGEQEIQARVIDVDRLEQQMAV